MNKKTKSFAVGLVAVLCFLLVFAIGFGVTGAWYQAKRQASGTVKMDQGIYLTFTNLKELNEGDLTNKMAGKILDKDGKVLGSTESGLNSSVAPASTVTIKNPTITGGTASVPFYVRAKVTYKVVLYSNAEGASTGDLDTKAGELSLTEVGLTEEGLFSTTALKFRNTDETAAKNWVAGADGWYYLGTAVTTEGLTKVTAGATPYKLFEGDDTSTLTFADYTTGRTDIERGGPRVTYKGTSDREVAQVLIVLDIQVVQAQNMTAEGLTGLEWKAA